jgi:hypothetical protein
MIKAQIEEEKENANQDFIKAKEIDPLFSNLPKEIKKDQNQSESSKPGPKGGKKDKLTKFIKGLPCTIKSSDEDKKIIRSNKCFNPLKKENFYIYEENTASREEVENKEINKIIKNDEISLGLSIFEKGAKGKLGGKTEEQSSNENSAIVAKHIFYSMTIKKEKDITFKDEFLKELKDIAEHKCSNEKKSEELDKIFQETGIYVPLKFYIGGLFEIQTEKTKQGGQKEHLREISANAKFGKYLAEVESSYKHEDSQESNIDSLIKKTSCIGGKMTLDYKNWVKGLKLDNSQIIEYSEFRDIFDFLNDDLKEKLNLKEPIDIIKKKYKKRINYEMIIEQLKRNKDQKIILNQENEYFPKTYEYAKTIELNRSELLQSGETNILEEKFQDIIIDFSIKVNINKKEILSYDNPLLKKEIIIKLKKDSSRYFKYFFSGLEGYKVKIFARLMEYPE